MTRILVFSDTHGKTEDALRVISRENAIDCIFHLGDCCRDAQILQQQTGKRVVSIRGNCDYDPSVPAKELVPIGGARILLMHGHQYYPDTALFHLSLAAQEANACAVCFGHTHRSLRTYENGILILNPGSISRPRDGVASYAILEVTNGDVAARICPLEG